MKKGKLINARYIRKRLKVLYERGDFENREALLEFGAAQGWTLHRHGLHYITFGSEEWDGERKRARVKFDFGDDDAFHAANGENKGRSRSKRSRKRLEKQLENPYIKKHYLSREPFSLPSHDLRWIYVIIAKTDRETSAYVGQASRISRRLKGHMHAKATRSSGPLQSWAKVRGAELLFCVVGSVAGALGKAEATRQATHLEGFWTERARLNGVLLPGVEGWGQFPAQPPDPDFALKWQEALAAARPLTGILAGEYAFDDICTDDASLDAVREHFERHRRDALRAKLTATYSGSDQI